MFVTFKESRVILMSLTPLLRSSDVSTDVGLTGTQEQFGRMPFLPPVMAHRGAGRS